MHARVNTGQVEPHRIDELVAATEPLLSRAKQQAPGLKSVMLLCDRGTGKLVIVSRWESEAVAGGRGAFLSGGHARTGALHHRAADPRAIRDPARGVSRRRALSSKDRSPAAGCCWARDNSATAYTSAFGSSMRQKRLQSTQRRAAR